MRQILDRRTSMPKVLFVLRAATVPRSTEILPLGFDWVITFVAPLGRSRGLPGCAPFCVKAFSGAVSAPSHLLGRSRVSPAAPHFALSRLCEISPSTRVARGALAGDPADAGDGVPCVARHRFWAVWSLASGYVPRSGLWRTGLSLRHGASWALRAVHKWAGRAAHIPAGIGDATTAAAQATWWGWAYCV